ncbi:MAG: Unknown protein [uncultured Campylobacterales bacterium]|uniref:UDP-N-acetyl-alpha-D-muramoyl-L-alanyl-L-glutamate epimerase n=1 Tax=uncultured Campylobacterales bacterium TaxID=352960 RepID=A0A6S6SIS3_9BACT|nr:MAG: Unknown protein [uncultured Campylobacterales bacterium]
MKQFNNLRQKYPIFTYKKYEINYKDDNLNLKFHYSFGDYKFIHNLSWQNIPKTDIKTLENIIFHIGLVESISYWKLTCSKELKIECGNIDEDQQNWFKKLFLNGLGEFIYINKILVSLDDFVNITCTKDLSTLPKVDIKTKEANLIPIGGGKDSCVTYELLKDDSSYLFAMNPIEPTRKIMANSSLKNIKMKRVLDPQIIELNKQEFLNGHVPFSSILSFISLLTASIYNLKYIPLSNESSANEENIIFNNIKINHQYSKSIEYENDFRSYYKKYLTDDIEYFSFLRPLHELHIAKLFSKYRYFHDIFLSCNVGSKRGVWCTKCPKCLFTFVMLHAYLDTKAMINIFGVNMLEDDSLKDMLKNLMGNGEIKPFECVGTYEEVNIALSLISKQYSELPSLLQKLDIKSHTIPTINWKEHNLTKMHLDILKNAF